jgi:hypothetical protein
MAEPYSEEHQEIAETILGEAFERLVAAGLGNIEALHGFVHFAIDTMPAFACRHCLPGEYEAIAQALEARIDEVPTMTEIAECVH